MDLSDFLLARIAEDEAVAREAAEVDRRLTESDGPAEDDAPWRARVSEDGSLPVVGLAVTRALAECDVKRRIVQAWQETAPTVAAWGGSPGWSDAVTQTTNEFLANDVLPLLALPYADHSDYNPEWTR